MQTHFFPSEGLAQILCFGSRGRFPNFTNGHKKKRILHRAGDFPSPFPSTWRDYGFTRRYWRQEGMKRKGEWKRKEKKGQGRSELGKRDRRGGKDKGSWRRRKERREGKVRGRRSPSSPLDSSTPERCSHNSCREGHAILVEWMESWTLSWLPGIIGDFTFLLLKSKVELLKKAFLSVMFLNKNDEYI